MITKIHPDVYDIDLPQIELHCESEERLQEIVNLFQVTIQKLQKNPKHDSAPCKKGRLAAESYWKCKWFSVHPRPRKRHPDMRLIFKAENGVLYIRRVAFRHIPPEIYELAKVREF